MHMHMHLHAYIHMLLLLSGHPLTGKATYIDYPLTVIHCTHIRTFTKNLIVQGHINIVKLDILLWTSGLLIQTSLNPFHLSSIVNDKSNRVLLHCQINRVVLNDKKG